MRLQGVAGRVIDLLTRLVNAPLAIHRIAVAFERQHELAVWTQTAEALWLVAHAPAPFDAQGQVVLQGSDQVAVGRIDAPLAIPSSPRLEAKLLAVACRKQIENRLPRPGRFLTRASRCGCQAAAPGYRARDRGLWLGWLGEDAGTGPA